MSQTVGVSNVFEAWLKLTFRLTVGDHWEEISARVVDGDTTYRWCREMIRESLSNLEHTLNPLLISSVLSIKDELCWLRSGHFQSSQWFGISPWQNTFAITCELARTLPNVHDKVEALTLAMISGSFGVNELGDCMALKTKIIEMLYRLDDENSEGKDRNDINRVFYIFADFLSEFKIDTEEERARMGERSMEMMKGEWRTPDTWCFGDFGDKKGQLSYPSAILVTREGGYLVLEQDSKGKKTTQRLQYFNNAGRYVKTILQRGHNSINGMVAMALDNDDNIVVTLKDDENMGRVNVYNMLGEWVRDMKPPSRDSKFPPYFTNVTVDRDSRVFVVEFHEMCVHIYQRNGDFIRKFGQAGRNAQQEIFENISSLSVSPSNEIYVCDPLRTVQVFDNEGNFLKFFKTHGSILTHVIVSEEEVCCLNREAHALEVFTLDGRRLLRKSGGYGEGLGRMNVPLGIARTPDDSIAVVEKEGNRVQVFNV